MKTIWFVTILVLSARAGLAQQAGVPTLSDDPVFNRVLARRVSYPARAIRSATYGRIYAGFDIDPRGHIQNISMLSPDNTGAGFEYEVRAALKRMPPLNPRYSGQYALPVAFVFTNARAESHLPTNTLPVSYFVGRRLLGEVIFRGELRSLGVYVPPTNQITYY